MLMLLLRYALLLTLLAVLPVFLIRVRPYDDSELRQFLAPPAGCPAPCFMGIRPGGTTVAAARSILQAHPLLANTIGLNPPYGLRFRANHAAGLITDQVFSYLEMRDNIIQWLRIHTNISLGDLWTVYGQPDWGTRTYTMGSSYIYYAIGYNEADISFEFMVNIERGRVRLRDVLRQKLTMRIGNTMKDYANMNPHLRQYTSTDLSWWHSS